MFLSHLLGEICRVCQLVLVNWSFWLRFGMNWGPIGLLTIQIDRSIPRITCRNTRTRSPDNQPWTTLFRRLIHSIVSEHGQVACCRRHLGHSDRHLHNRSPSTRRLVAALLGDRAWPMVHSPAKHIHNPPRDSSRRARTQRIATYQPRPSQHRCELAWALPPQPLARIHTGTRKRHSIDTRMHVPRSKT